MVIENFLQYIRKAVNAGMSYERKISIDQMQQYFKTINISNFIVKAGPKVNVGLSQIFKIMQQGFANEKCLSLLTY